MSDMQNLVVETVILNFSIGTGFCFVFDRIGLELFTYFYNDYPDDMKENLSADASSCPLDIGTNISKGPLHIFNEYTTTQSFDYALIIH